MKLEGRSGGWDCARVKPIEDDKTMWTKVDFEDAGQDFVGVHFDPKTKKIEWTELSSLGSLYIGADVLNPNLGVGDRLEIQTASGRMQIKYPVESVTSVRKADVVIACLKPRQESRKVAA